MTLQRGTRMLDLGAILDEILYEVRPHFGKGRVASYIPALKRIPPDEFGMTVVLTDGREFSIGDATERFSIQSISKMFTLMLAMSAVGDEVWRRVGKEPSGTPFNSLVQLEAAADRQRPRKPLGTPTSCRACSTVRTSVPACSWNCRPAGVNVVPALLRTNGVQPNCCSSA